MGHLKTLLEAGESLFIEKVAVDPALNKRFSGVQSKVPTAPTTPAPRQPPLPSPAAMMRAVSPKSPAPAPAPTTATPSTHYGGRTRNGLSLYEAFGKGVNSLMGKDWAGVAPGGEVGQPAPPPGTESTATKAELRDYAQGASNPIEAFGQTWNQSVRDPAYRRMRTPTAQRVMGFTQDDPRTGQSVYTGSPAPDVPVGSKATPGAYGGPAPGVSGYLRDAGRTALSTIGMAPSLAIDAARGDKDMNYSKMMGRSLMSLPNSILGTNIGGNVEARPAGEFGTSIGPDKGRGFFGEYTDPVTGQPVPGALESVAKHHRNEATRPDAEGGGPWSRAGSSFVAPIAGNAETGLQLMLGGGLGKGLLSKSRHASTVKQLSKVPLAGSLAAHPARTLAGLPTGMGVIQGAESRVHDVTKDPIPRQQRLAGQFDYNKHQDEVVDSMGQPASGGKFDQGAFDARTNAAAAPYLAAQLQAEAARIEAGTTPPGQGHATGPVQPAAAPGQAQMGVTDRISALPREQQTAAITALPQDQQPAAVKGVLTGRVEAWVKENRPDATPAEQAQEVGALIQRLSKDGLNADDMSTGIGNLADEMKADVSQPGMLEKLWQGFLGMDTWQQLALIIGVPLAIGGFANAMFGQGGMGSILLGLGGAAAAGAGYLGTGGMKDLYNKGNGALGFAPPVTDEAAAAGVKLTAGDDLMGQIGKLQKSDGGLSPAEFGQIAGNPEVLSQVSNLPDAELAQMLQTADPELRKMLDPMIQPVTAFGRQLYAQPPPQMIVSSLATKGITITPAQAMRLQRIYGQTQSQQ